MIFEQIESATTRAVEKQFPLFRLAFDWIRVLPPAPADAIVELRGPEMFAHIQGYNTLDRAQCRWESHRHTVDIQYCLAGGEQIDWLTAGSLRSMDDYNDKKDTEHWHASDLAPISLRMTAGSYVVFFNGELHRPKVADQIHPAVRKLVVKIPAKLLELPA